MYTWCAISYFFQKINVIIMATFHTFCPQNPYWIWCILQQVDPKINRNVFCQWNFVLLYHKKNNNWTIKPQPCCKYYVYNNADEVVSKVTTCLAVPSILFSLKSLIRKKRTLYVRGIYVSFNGDTHVPSVSCSPVFWSYLISSCRKYPRPITKAPSHWPMSISGFILWNAKKIFSITMATHCSHKP